MHRILAIFGSLGLALVVAVAALYVLGGARLAAAITDIAPGGAHYVHAGFPFAVNDGNGTQICISSRSGRSLPPFVVPPSDLHFSTYASAGMRLNVQADVPFVIHDTNGTQICISTRAGRSVPPFVIP